MSGRERTRHDDPDELPEGPLDPWTGLPGIDRPTNITPMGQIEQYGLFADGLNRLRRGNDSSWRRALVPLGLGIVVVLLLLVALGLVT